MSGVSFPSRRTSRPSSRQQPRATRLLRLKAWTRAAVFAASAQTRGSSRLRMAVSALSSERMSLLLAAKYFSKDPCQSRWFGEALRNAATPALKFRACSSWKLESSVT